MKISFCTSCMGRVHHLKETLPQNIRDNPASDDLDVEFVVLNYNSQDDLHEWITTDPEMSKHIESGLIRYGKTTDPEFFHMSHAKNMAHRMATGDIVCNLDADNFTGEGFAAYLRSVFKKDDNVVLNPSHRVSKLFPPDDRGFFGRVAVSKENFMKLRGYDESFSGWGNEDTDLMQRAKGLGLRHLRIDTTRYLGIIKHSNEERVENMFEGERRDIELEKVEGMKNQNKSALHKLFNKLKILGNPIQANPDGNFGNGRVLMSDGNAVHLDTIKEGAMSSFNVCALGLPELLRGRIAPRVIKKSDVGFDSNVDFS